MDKEADVPNTNPQRDSIFTNGQSGVLGRASNKIASSSKFGIYATTKPQGHGFKRTWPPLLKIDESETPKVRKLLPAQFAATRRLPYFSNAYSAVGVRM